MAAEILDSSGTEFFLALDGTTKVAFDCPTGYNGLGFTTNERESSCINETVTISRPGKRKLSNFTVPFRLVPGSDVHQYLLGLTTESNANLELPYAIALTDGTVDPVLAAGAFTPPGTGPAWTRTCVVGTFKVGSVTIDIADDTDVMGSFTVIPQSQTWMFKV